MGKRKRTEIETVETTGTPKVSVVETPVIDVKKYFRLMQYPKYSYIRAFMETEYRDILKTKDEWDMELKNYMGGDKK